MTDVLVSEAVKPTAQRAYKSAVITLAPKTSSLTVRIPTPTGSNGVTWTGTAQVTIVVEIDGVQHRTTFNAIGGVRQRPHGLGVRDAAVVTWNLPTGFFGAGEGIPEELWNLVTAKRLGETAKVSYRAWVEATRRSGTIDATIQLLAEVEDAPAIEFHHSIAYDTASSVIEDDGGDGAVSLSFTAGAGSNRAAFVWCSSDRDNVQSTHTVTYGGVSPTITRPINTANSFMRLTADIFIDSEIGSGAKTIAFTSSGGSGSNFGGTCIGVITASGVHQTVPVGTAQVVSSNSAANPSLTVASINSTDLVVDAGSFYGPVTMTVGASQTARVNAATGNNNTFGSTQLGSAGGAMTWSRSGGNEYSFGAVAFKEAAAGTTVTPGVVALVISAFAPIIGRAYIPPVTALATTPFAPAIVGGNVVTVPVKTLATTTFAPTVVTPQTVVPPVQTLALSTFAPVVALPQLVTVPVKTLALTSFAPTVSVSDNKVIVPPTATLVMAGQVPSSPVGTIIVPGVINVAITTFVAAIVNPLTVTPSTCTLTTSVFAPPIVVGVRATPGPASLTVSSAVPTVGLPVLVVPSTTALTLTPHASSVAQVGVFVPDTAVLTVGAYAPSVTTPQTIVVPVTPIVLSTFNPSVGNPIIVVPATKSVALSTYAPSVESSITIGVPTQTLVITPLVPSVGQSQTVVVPNVNLSLSSSVPSVLVSVLVSPLPLLLVLASSPPNALVPLSIVPGTAHLVITTYAPATAQPSIAGIVIDGTNVVGIVVDSATPTTVIDSLTFGVIIDG